MGKRRIRNLKELGENEIIGFDVQKDRCEDIGKKYSICTFTEIDSALNEKPDAMIISTPPDLHMKYAKIALENNIHFFTEASVVLDEMLEVIQKLKTSNTKGIPSCTLRYHPIITTVQQLLESKVIGKPLVVMYHSGQYLPDWHPWEDYRKFYVSKKETGACREIVPFELIWMTKIFGRINSVIGRKRKITNLETDIDDIYSVLIEFENNIECNLIVDVISRYPYRQLKILGEEGVIIADWSDRSVRYFSKDKTWNNVKIDDGKIEENYVHGELSYVKEMSDFIKSIKGEILQSYTFEDDYKILNILNAIERSSDTGIKQSIN